MPAAFLPGTGDAQIHQLRGHDERQTHTVEGVDEYRLMVEHFAECALDDLPLRYDAAEAARNMRVIEALYRSARNGGAVEVLAG